MLNLWLNLIDWMLDRAGANTHNPMTLRLEWYDKKRKQTILMLTYTKNHEHFMTGQMHPSRREGLRAADAALDKHPFIFEDNTI